MHEDVGVRADRVLTQHDFETLRHLDTPVAQRRRTGGDQRVTLRIEAGGLDIHHNATL